MYKPNPKSHIPQKLVTFFVSLFPSEFLSVDEFSIILHSLHDEEESEEYDEDEDEYSEKSNENTGGVSQNVAKTIK